MWKILPDSRYVANPANGSRHQRGAAVDVTLVTATGDALEMTTAFDDFTPRAAAVRTRQPRCPAPPQAPPAGDDSRRLRHPCHCEWWHFDDSGWRRYPLADVGAEKLEAGSKVSAKPRPATTPVAFPDTSPANPPR